MYGQVEGTRRAGGEGIHGFEVGEEDSGTGQLAIGVEHGSGIAAEVDPLVHEMGVVDARALDGEGADKAAGHGDLEGDVGVGFADGVDDALDLDPVAIFVAG